MYKLEDLNLEELRNLKNELNEKISEHGMSPTIFKKFKTTFSGHFHHPNRIQNIQYLGALFHLTWQCYGDRRGFTVFDCDTGEYELIENEHCIFERIYYDDSEGFDMPSQEVLERELGQRIVEVVVTSKNEPKTYKKFRDLLEKVDIVDLNVVERYLLNSVDRESAEQVMENAQKDSPVETVIQYIQEYSKAESNIVKNELEELHQKAVDMMAEGE